MLLNALLLFCISLTTAFNISPAPNIIIEKPKLVTFMNQTRSSYFGFQINLRKNHVLIGAPRAQSTLEQQRKVQETGAIFKCNFDNEPQPCHPYHFDLNGNTHVENDIAYNSEKKDFQLLGFAMDGNENEDDRFVACAPKLKADLEDSDHYLLHGICYWVQTTNSSQPSGVRQINPLRQKNLQTLKGESDVNYYYYIYGQSGFSVHVTDDNEEIIIGAVGISNWKGSIIRYRGGKRPDLGGLSRRDLDQNPYRHIVRRRQVGIEYRSEIPSPFYSPLTDDSYFGYSVSSAKFLPNNDSLFYVASAPQSNHQSGEVFIFDIEDYRLDKKIKVYNKFIGDKFGEYFGYVVLCEDFNNDGMPDLAVSAPLYSKNGLYENGGVYVFINKGNLAFDKQPLILSEYDGSGRFGTSMSRIGDINLDGFNDLAISSPFEGNGAVYIFLGSAQGLSSKPSQKIQAPSEPVSPYEEIYASSMFGYGLSKGVDIDSNGYRDIAIGSPNSETVYVFKTYPVVKVLASIMSSKPELTLDDTSIVVKVCTSLQTKTEIDRELEFETTLSLDLKHGRASFSPREADRNVNSTIKITQVESCSDYNIYVRGNIADIFKPVIIDFRYDLKDKIPEYDSNFCETCVALDPSDNKIASKKIPFSTGCGDERCVPDLVVVGTLVNVRQPYVLGSTKTIEIKYEISNTRESAYLTQLSVKIPSNVTDFSRIPSSCRIQDSPTRETMICDINQGKPIKSQETVELIVYLDATRLDGESLKIFANVTSAGDEFRPVDNFYTNEIILTEFSDIEFNGVSSAMQLSLEDGLRVENLQYKYEIYNNGPSTVKAISLKVYIPIVYIPYPNYYIPIINASDISTSGFYINKVLDYKTKSNGNWVQPSNDINLLLTDNSFDSSKMGYDYDLNADRTDQDYNTLGQSSHRRRRSPQQPQRIYNRYTRNVVEEPLVTFRTPIVDKEDATLLNLPRNRTIVLDCIDDLNECIEIEFIVRNFRPGSEPVILHFNFSMNLQKIDEIFNEKQNIFLYKFNAIAMRINENLSTQSSLKTTLRNPYTIVYEKFKSKTPIWIYVVSIIVGLLILILMCYCFYKLGFFKRTQKEELEKMVRESRNITSEQAEELRNLNT